MLFLRELEKDEFGIYVFDSIDALSSDELEVQADERITAFEKDKEYTKGSYQQEKAKFMSSVFLPQVCDLAERKNCLVILVSQLRDNVNGGMYASKNRIASGRALLFYSSSRIWLTAKSEIEKNGRSLGNIVQAETHKARGPRPYRKCFYIFYYEYGIDDVGSNIDYLYDLRTKDKGELKESKKGLILVEWNGNEMSRTALMDYIETHNLEYDLQKRVQEKWEEEEKEAAEEISGRKRRFTEAKNEING
jgi:hypothetical protein